MCMMAEWWLEDEASINLVTVNIPATFTQVLPYNPMRFVLVLGGLNSQTISYAFGDNQPSTEMTQITSASHTLILTRSQLGSIICMPVWIRSGGGAVSLQLTEGVYNAQRFNLYRGWVNEHISKLSTS